MTVREVAARIGVSPKRIETAMKRFNIPRRKSTSRNQTGPANPRWKGVDASYAAKHMRVSKVRGRPLVCDVCGVEDPSLKYEWANLTGNYDDPSDYRRMCKSCHGKHDAVSRVNINRVRALVELCKLIAPKLGLEDRESLLASIENLVAPMRAHAPRQSSRRSGAEVQ
jgi:hypothetical protein